MMPTPSKAEYASAANLSCSFLSLSNEIITSIVYELHPREAIFLSLTCRALFHGVLSSQNYYLWYKVGGFSKQMPGHKAGWKLVKKVDEIMQRPLLAPPHPSSAPNGDSCGASTSSGDEAPISTNKRNATLPLDADKGKGKAFSRKKSTRMELVQAAKSYSPAEVLVDYKQFLVETMLGDTDTGCQWCLAKPMTRKIYGRWKLRLCEGCFYENVIS